MAKTANVKCATCDKPIRSTRAQGVAKCRACSTPQHGTVGKYRGGCRCDECRAAKAAEMRAYTRARTQRDGMSQFASQRAKKGRSDGGDYIPEALRMTACAVCGTEVLKRDPASPIPAMHRRCRDSAEGWRIAQRAKGIPTRRMAEFRRKMEKAASGRPSTNRVFIQGPCEWCAEPFCAPMGKWCSSACRTKSKLSTRKPTAFNPKPQLRRDIYERDKWICGICTQPIDPNLAWPHKWSASLDHIVPQSHMLIPDHSARNLRAAHLYCNSMRGNGSNMPEDMLAERLGYEFEA